MHKSDFKEEELAYKKAVKNKYGDRIISSDIDAEWNKIVSEKKNPLSFMEGMGSITSTGVRKFGGSGGMKRVANAYSIDRVFDIPHNPFRNRLAIETPQNMVELYQRFRYYYQREPLVGTAIDLHSEFPLSSFELNHEDSTLKEEFNDIAEELELFDFMLDMSHEYYCVGETFPFGIFDDAKDPQVWRKFILLNPLNMDIQHVPITDGRPNYTYRLKIDEVIKEIVKKGTGDPQTKELYDAIPSDVREAARTTGYMNLNQNQISHFKRKGSYFKVRGESLMMRILHLLSYRDKLRDAQYMICDRSSTPRELWKVGEPNSPASPEELQALADLVRQSYLDPSQAIIWHHAVSVDVIGLSEKILPLRQELDSIENEMLVGLMLNKGFLDSSYGAYANMSVSLDVLISRYLTLRTRLELWMKNAVWAPLCRIHNIYKPTKAELDHKIRIKGARKKPWVPDIVWSKHELRDNNQKIQLFMQLREKLGQPGFPRDLIYQAINENPRTIRKLIDKEVKDDIVNNRVQMGPGGKKPGGGGVGGGMGGGGVGGEMGLNLKNLGSPIGEIPGPPGAKDQNLGDGVSMKPPESGNAQTFGTGAPGSF